MQKKNFLPILALAVGHLVTDLQAGALPIVLPHLKELFTLSYSQLAAIVLTQNITSSVIQPVFGYITDKRSMPVLLPFCAAMAGAGFAAIGWVSSYSLILLTVIIIGIASATYHPQASKTVNFLSDENSKEKRNKIMANPIVTFEMENGDIMKAELYPEIAPNTVNNFISLINKGFYDGLIFHRVIRGFMIQGGCPNGNGMGGPGYAIKGEFAQNGFQNDLAHDPGVLSMARAMHPDSAGSQFFIMHEKSPHLDGAYAAFGKITEGMDIVNKIAETATDYSDRPLEEQRMKKVTVELFGETYDEPETV